jgi:hypothetical protein
VSNSRGAAAQTAAPSGPNREALDFAPIDVLTLEATPGLVRGFDADAQSGDLGGALIGAKLAALGIRANALKFEIAGRPGVHTTELAGTLATVDAWMIGSGYADAKPCLWFFGVLCDEATGFVGFGGSLIGLQHDTESTRSALRLAEVDAVFSLTPAFAAGWSRYRLLPRVGISSDYVWNPPGGSDRFVFRLDAGADAAARFMGLDFALAVRWRPALDRFSDDYGIETTLETSVRRSWKGGFDPVGDAIRFGVQIGYAYWRVPALSYGPDWLLFAKNTGFVRLVVAPSFFSAVPPPRK